VASTAISESGADKWRGWNLICALLLFVSMYLDKGKTNIQPQNYSRLNTPGVTIALDSLDLVV